MIRRVLVVDDDDVIRRVLESLLDLEDFAVTAAADGETALRIARELAVDVIVLDVMMPGLDGLDVCRALKGDPRTAAVPVVLLTARDRDEDRRRGHEAGCDAYVTKPFSPLDLIAALSALSPLERT